MLTLLGAGQGQNGIGFDADYQAVLTFATDNSIGLPTPAQQVKQNQLVLDLKAGGAWNQLDVLYIFANNSGTQFATINWKRPNSNRASIVNTLNFTDNVGFNNTSGIGGGYLNTNYTPTGSGNYKANTAGRYIWINATNGSLAFDGVNGTNANRMTLANSAAQYINTGTVDGGGANSYNTSAGMKSIQRLASNDFRTYNGKIQASLVSTNATPSVGAISQFVLRSNASSSAHTASMYAMGANLATSSSQTIYDNFVDLITAYINNPQ